MSVNESVLTDVGMVQQLQATDRNIEAERKRAICRFSHKPVHGRSFCDTQIRAQACTHVMQHQGWSCFLVVLFVHELKQIFPSCLRWTCWSFLSPSHKHDKCQANKCKYFTVYFLILCNWTYRWIMPKSKKKKFTLTKKRSPNILYLLSLG